MFSARQALETVVSARKIIIAAKIPFSRPEGYFCEMIKTEEQMSNINKKKAEEKAAMKVAEDARKQRLNRKFGKKVQLERELEKQQRRSEDMKKLNKLRKRPQKQNDEFEIDVEEEVEGNYSHSTSKRSKLGEKHVSKKRQARDEKYGFGGRKRGLKKNDKESANRDDFDVARNRRPFQGMQKGGRRGGKKQQRPGKMRRQQIRTRKLNSKK